MDRLKELQARLTDDINPLTAEELTELAGLIRERVADIDPAAATADDIAALQEAADNIKIVEAQQTALAEAAAERAATAAELLGQVGVSAEAGEPVEAEEPATEITEPVAAEVVEPTAGVPSEPAPAGDPLQLPEPVAAAATPPAAPVLPRISHLAARTPRRARPDASLTASANRSPAPLIAAAELPGIGAGEEVALDRWAVAAARRMDTLMKTTGPGRELVHLGRKQFTYPEERQFTSNPTVNQARLEAVAGPEALAASGGICGPVAVDYSIGTIAQADRPVATSLVQFGASRGGLRYILPHTLAAVTADGPAALWTEANDVNPTSPTTKPHATFVCQTPQEAYVNAVTSIVQFGNFQARYFPEQVTQYMDTALAVHARLAEAALLNTITAGSTLVTAGNLDLGAARELLGIIDRASAAMRYRHRMPLNSFLRVLYPAWLDDMIRADLAKNLPGDSGGQAERLAVADAEIANFFAVRGINVTAVEDSPTGAAVLQGFGAQGAGQLLPWPSHTYLWMYPEGSWTFLDGGELNLGMVRDSTLNAQNNFQFFTETFENAIFRGHESQRLDLTIDPTGATIGTIAPLANTEVAGS